MRSEKHASWTKTFRVYCVRCVFLVGCLYAIAIGTLVSFETKLVFPGASGGDWEQNEIEHRSVWFDSQDGTKINGWYLAPLEKKSSGTEFAILMSHGNGENVTMMLREADQFRKSFGLPVLIYDYRGFGQSLGEPSESKVLQDADAAMEWLQRETKLPSNKIFQFGRSLGGGVAVHLASKFGSAGLILDRTFNSVVDVAAERYWMMPVRWVIRNSFHSDQRIKSYTGPLLQMHGDQDSVIDQKFARRLFAASPSLDKQFLLSPGTTHIDWWPAVFTETADAFIARLMADNGDAAESKTVNMQSENPATLP